MTIKSPLTVSLVGILLFGYFELLGGSFTILEFNNLTRF